MKSKKIMSIILSISLIISAALASNCIVNAATTLHGTVTSKQGLNVRSESNTSSKIIGTLKLDDNIEILESTNDWYKIKFGSSYGYVSKQYIKLDESTSSNGTTSTDNATSNNSGTSTNGAASTGTTSTNNTTSNTSTGSNSDSGSGSADTPSGYKNLDEVKDVDKLKQWKITFNKNIEDTDSNRNEFKIVDTKGNFVSTKVLIDNSTVTVVPWDNGYNYEESYKLIVGDNIEATDGTKIKYTSTMPFTVKSKIASLGLGKTETEYINNDKSYEWYVSQDNSGEYSNVNSGPACVAMAIKWKTSSASKSVEDIRNTYEFSGAPWNNDTIVAYLKSLSIDYNYCNDITEDALKSQIKSGNIIIANLNPQYINYNNSAESKTGRFHAVDGSTYSVIIKGYKIVDGKTYFEIYDPFNNNINYLDGYPRGRNDYYSSSEILNSLTAESVQPIIINK